MSQKKQITITGSAGEGPTALSAFDHALHLCGIGNYNLIHLSSIIPSNYRPVVKHIDRNGIEHGDRLYVVYASRSTQTLGETAAAGLGWCMTKGKPQWGLFVEHTGDSKESVKLQIEASLIRMKSYRDNEEWGDIESHIVEAHCKDHPVCAVAVALYRSEPWS